MSVGMSANYDKAAGVYTLTLCWHNGKKPKDIAQAADWAYNFLGLRKGLKL